MVNGDREHLEPSEDNSNNYTRERLTLQSYIETKKILLPIIILSTKKFVKFHGNWSALALCAPHTPRKQQQQQQPHQRRATTTTAFCTTHKCTTLSSLLAAKKNSWNQISRIFFCNSCRAAKVPRPTTLLGARFVIKVSFITMIINIFMLIHHYTTKIY